MRTPILARLAALLPGLTACHLAARAPSVPRATTSGAVADLFVCDTAQPSRSDCHLRESGAIVVPASGIHAEVSVAYVFGCPAANRGSSLRLFQSDGPEQELRFDTTATLTFVTDGPLRIRDDNDAWTRSRRFNPGAACGLSLTYAFVPSAQQVARWSERTTAVVELVRTTIELYDLRREVQYWYERYIGAPDVIGGILRDRARDLLASDRLRDRQLGASLQAIADNAPQAMIMEPYATHRLALQRYRDDARALQSEMAAWRQAVQDALAAALSDAEAALGV
jgi:hypothetical protein